MHVVVVNKVCITLLCIYNSKVQVMCISTDIVLLKPFCSCFKEIEPELPCSYDINFKLLAVFQVAFLPKQLNEEGQL